MSFGVKCLFSVPKSCCNESTLKTIGNYIYFHGAGYGVAIFTRDGRLAKFIKKTDDFARLYALHLHVGWAAYHFFGYGDGMSPRCACPYGTCGAELEVCTDGGQCTTLCPAPRYSCDDGNFAAPFYVPPYIYVDGHDTGVRIYKYTMGGYVDDWQFGPYATNASLGILPYDDSTFYVAWSSGGLGPSDVYRCTWDVLTRRWKSTRYMKDSCTHIASNKPYYGRGVQSLPELGGWLFGDFAVLLRPDGRVEKLNFTKRFFMTRYGFDMHAGSSKVRVVDIHAGDVTQTIELPHPLTPGSSVLQVDLPYLVLTGPDSYYVCLITYNGVAPAIQYKAGNGGLLYRVVDLLTYRPLRARVKTWCSEVGYPQRRVPVASSPTTVEVDDWRPIPNCGKVLTIEIADVYDASDGQASMDPTADSLTVYYASSKPLNPLPMLIGAAGAAAFTASFAYTRQKKSG
jgi:hypothetical protein